ncbi:hypothetical protein CC77DRAFT_1026017 [Alternaria alternata]|jgi:hypothetical protein|uniref:Uncharacterized protein n=1 Tax=Alternaria alternata TaxID=5599 RepID=A0A177D3W5_ALTAL|nr:hypothetical protein CC77DRAFT_1026017 [Alternaria alternata]OAG14168.1 hypothetical protein CC77DRAFT_1026017 [Alternaria alternata]
MYGGGLEKKKFNTNALWKLSVTWPGAVVAILCLLHTYADEVSLYVTVFASYHMFDNAVICLKGIR